MEHLKNNQMVIGSLCAVACETLFGLSYLFTIQATGKASVLAVLAWRFLIALVGMSVCLALGVFKVNLKGKKLRPLLTIALFSPLIYYIGETIGISRTTASESGTLLACIPVASLVASSLLLKKRPNHFQVVGILLTLVGVLFTVFALGITASLDLLGYFFLVVAVIAYALYSVFVDRAQAFSSGEITYVMLTVGAVVFVAAALLESLTSGNVVELICLPTDAGFLLAVLYQGIGCSVLAVFLSNVAIAKIGVNRTSSFIGLSTVVAIVTGVLLLQEQFSVYQMLGVLIIVAGVYVANQLERVAN